jgi:small-conductance mechanosensitive channel
LIFFSNLHPIPYVRVTDFQNFAAEYSLYIFTNQLKRIRLIDSNLKKIVLEIFRKDGIDLNTPTLIKNVNGKNN